MPRKKQDKGWLGGPRRPAVVRSYAEQRAAAARKAEQVRDQEGAGLAPGVLEAEAEVLDAEDREVDLDRPVVPRGTLGGFT
jgi:hypothetical protein